MPQNHTIFISYRRSDAVGHARALHRDLCRRFEKDLIFFDRQSIESGDVFPEEFASFLLIDPELRRPFMQHHRDLLDAEYWKGVQQDIRNGRQRDVFPYSIIKRFRYIYGEE